MKVVDLDEGFILDHAPARYLVASLGVAVEEPGQGEALAALLTAEKAMTRIVANGYGDDEMKQQLEKAIAAARTGDFDGFRAVAEKLQVDDRLTAAVDFEQQQLLKKAGGGGLESGSADGKGLDEEAEKENARRRAQAQSDEELAISAAAAYAILKLLEEKPEAPAARNRAVEIFLNALVEEAKGRGLALEGQARSSLSAGNQTAAAAGENAEMTQGKKPLPPPRKSAGVEI